MRRPAIYYSNTSEIIFSLKIAYISVLLFRWVFSAALEENNEKNLNSYKRQIQ